MPSCAAIGCAVRFQVGRYAQHFVDTLDMSVSPVEYLLNK